MAAIDVGGDGRVVVCLGFPVFHQDSYVERLRELGGVEPIL